MHEYHELIAEHQELQKQLADQPEVVELERVLCLIAQARDAGANIGDPHQREQLRAILRHWGAYVYDHTGEYPPTQLTPYEPHAIPVQIPTLRKRVIPSWTWLLGGAVVLVVIVSMGILATPSSTDMRATVEAAATASALAGTATAEVATTVTAQTAGATATAYAQAFAATATAAAEAVTPTPTRTSTPEPTSTPTRTPTPLATPRPTLGPTPTPHPAAIRPDNANQLVPLTRLVGHEGAVLQVAFSPDSHFLASSGADGTVRLWSVTDRKELATLTAHVGWVQTGAFSPDGRWLASGGNDGVVRLWDTDKLQAFAEFYGHEGFVFDVAFSPDGRLLASGSGDGTVRIWDVESGSEVDVIVDSENAIYGIAFSPDGARLATASVAGTVGIWEVATGAELCRFNTSVVPVLRVGSPRRGVESPNMAIYQVSYVYQHVMEAPPNISPALRVASPALSVAFAPDGNSLATGNTEGQVIILNARTCQEKQVLEGHTDNVNAVVYSPDGQILVSGSRDTTMKVWPLAQASIAPVTLRGHEESVETVAFSPDGRLLASASADGIIILWGLPVP